MKDVQSTKKRLLRCVLDPLPDSVGKVSVVVFLLPDLKDNLVGCKRGTESGVRV